MKDEVYADHRNNPDYFVDKDSMKKPKSIELVNLEKLIADCPEVATKYENGAYGNLTMKKGKKLQNLMKKTANMKEKGQRLSVIADYNTVMSAEASK